MEIPLELKDSIEKIWLAGLGALTLAEQEGSKLFKDLVEKGQNFKGIPLPTDQVVPKMDDVRNRFTGIFDKLQGIVNSGISFGLSKMGVPSKDEIELLTSRVEQLMKSVENLKPSDLQEEVTQEGEEDGEPQKAKATSRRTTRKATTKSE